jgi:integrase
MGTAMSACLKVPSYRRHKQSGQAVVTLPDGLGGRKDVLLGKYATKASRTEYARVIAEWEATGRRLPQAIEKHDDLTIIELIAAFWEHAEQHYRHPDGSPTGELNDYRLSLKPLKEMYGETSAGRFGPLALKAIRQKMIEADLCRGVINQRIGRIRRMFRWGVENELIPPSVVQGLEAVRGLQKGRSAARDTEPVRPVPEAFVNAILPHVRPQVAAMVQLQLATGMRSGELCILRTIDIDMTGKVWLYKPTAHKTQHHGHGRIIAIGPQGQEILRPFLKTDLYAFIFDPREAMAKLRTEQRKKRKSPVQPSQIDRRRRHPKKKLRDRYYPKTYAKAIARGCEKAGVPHFHPHQLRHNKATEIRREAGLDAARAVLGHRGPAVTELYAELDMGKAIEVMSKLG